MTLANVRGSLLPPSGSLARLPILFLLIFLLYSTQQAFATQLYWVGGSGNWNELTHWSLSSGNSQGLLSPSIPQAGDDVIFDGNSGFSAGRTEVFVNLQANCKNFIVKGAVIAPVFNGMRLNIYGSADFQNGVVLNNSLYFSATGAEQVSFNGGVTGSAAIFFIGTGSYTLSGILNISKIYFLQGTLNLGSSKITAGFFDESGCCGTTPFNPVSNRILDLGSSSITLTDRNSQSNADSPSWAYTGKTLISGTSKIILTKSIADGYAVRFLTGNDHHYNDVSFSSTDHGSKNSTPYQWYQVDGRKCTFRKLSFASDGYLATDCTVDTLITAASRRYFLYGQQTIGSLQNSTDYCDAYWSLSGIGGQQAIIQIPNSQSIKNARLSYIKLIGGRLTADNGIDAGNNVGIDFIPKARNLYWIGGGGNWQDRKHWTTNADGTPSGGCLPSRNDNVFFGSYSGEISIEKPVSINADEAECLSIHWEGVAGSPAFVSEKPQYGLSIFGSSTWQKTMVYSVANTLYAGIGRDQIIRSNSVVIHGDTRFESTGKWSLADSFTSDGDLVFLSGTLHTNSQFVSVKNFGANSRATGGRSLDISNSLMTIGGNWSYIDFDGPPIDLTAENSTIQMTGKNPLFRYNSGLNYYNLDFKESEGAANLYADIYSTKQPCKFETLRFQGNARINVLGNPTPLYLSELVLSSGKEYMIGTNMTVTTQHLNLSDQSCKGTGIIRSGTAGTQAILYLTKAHSLSRFELKDIKCTGEQLTVIDGIDGGNNVNVRVEAASAKDLYWTGGSGAWSDLSHWSYHSNGKASAVTCLPTPLDHIHFNQYSGTNYQVDLDIPAVCGDMTWDEVSGSHPGISGNSGNTLTISGSLTLQRGMRFDVEKVEFTGKGKKSITTNSVVLGYYASNFSEKGVFFNGYGASWKLTDSLKVKNIGIINGTLSTQGNFIEAENWVSGWTNDRKSTKLILRSSTIKIGGYWDSSGIDSLEADSSIISMEGTMPVNNESGNGLYTNYFRSAAGHKFHKVNFDNSLLEAKVICADILKGYAFDGAFFAGPVSINSSNKFFRFSTAGNVHLWSGSLQQIDQWVTTSGCQQWDLDNNCISSGAAGGCGLTQKARINSNFPLAISNVRISGIEISGPDEHTAFGTDMGNNSGWTFLPYAGRTLYWIGGSGNYDDPAHWTINSDGRASGNTCSPSRNDHVIFNRFSGDDLSVSIKNIAECKDMRWIDVPGKPSIDGLINCYGSLSLQATVIHNGGINFLSTGSEIIETKGAVVARNYDVNFSGGGRYLLMDDFTTDSHLNITKGELNTNSKTVKALTFNGSDNSLYDTDKTSLILGSSNIYVSYYSGGWQYTGSRLDAGTSHIHLVGNANVFRARDGAKYHNISFNTIPNAVQKIYGSFMADTLTFARTNSTYQLEANKTITINEQLNMSGTPCATVSISSTLPNEQANLNILGGDTTYNFVSISQINAAGKKLRMLSQSTDLGFNTNIVFTSNQNVGIGLLGPDQTLCTAQFPIKLSARTFLPDQNTKIKWHDVTSGKAIGDSTDLKINSPGVYAVTINYAQDCFVTDTVNILADKISDFWKSVRIVQPSCSRSYGIIQLPDGDRSYSVDGRSFSDTLTYQLSSGIHYIIAKSKAGCLSDSVSFAIDQQPQKPMASIQYPYSVVRTTGKLDVTLLGTKGGIFKSFPEGLDLDSLNGAINLSKSFPGKDYTITYRVGSGDCSTVVSTTLRILNTPTNIQYPLPDYCAVGTAGISTEGVEEGEYKASPSGLVLDRHSGSIDLSQSLPGRYTITYTYYDGALKQSAETFIKVNALPDVSISGTETTILEGQTLELTANGGYTYGWIGDDILSPTNQKSITIRPKQTMTYRVLVTNEEGCSRSADITINVRKPVKPVPNNVITPNGDGKNDFWVIAHIEDFPNNNVKIFDRAGRLIYSKNGYRNEWDGYLDGKVLNEDGYIYVLDLGNGQALLRGVISVVLGAKTKL